MANNWYPVIVMTLFVLAIVGMVSILFWLEKRQQARTKALFEPYRSLLNKSQVDTKHYQSRLHLEECEHLH